jgi:hypothetical protein
MVMQVEGARIDVHDQLLDDIVDSNDLDGDALAHWLSSTLCNELGVDRIERDEDGDIPVKYGPATVYVRADESNATFVTVVGLLLEGFEPAPEVYAAVNAINLQVPMAKTFVDVDATQILTMVQLPVVDTLSPRDLMLAIATVADTVDYFDTLLQNRFGGSTSTDA